MTRPWLLGLFALVLMTGTGKAVADDPPISFRQQIAPILVKSCLGCHNAKKAESGLDVSTFALLRKGGKSAGGDILVPGDPDASVLIEVIGPEAEPRMPLKLTPLSQANIDTISRWIEQGARFDGPSESQTPLISLVDPLKDLPRIAVKGHPTDPVTSVAFSPDGSTIAKATGRKVELLDTSSGKLRATLDPHPGSLSVVRFTADGSRLLAAGGRPGLFGAVTIWEVATGKRLLEERAHSDMILSAEVSPDGKTLATAGYDRLVILWDLATLKPSRTLKDHTDSVYALAFAPSGKTLGSVGADRTVKLWDVDSGRREVTLSDATAELYTVAFSSDGSTVLAAGVNRSIRAWRVAGKDSSLAGTAFAHEAAVLRLVASPDGKLLISSGEDRYVKVWDLVSLAPRFSLARQSDWPQAIALSPDGSRLAVGRYDGSLALYDTATGKVLADLTTKPKPASPAARKRELTRNATLDRPNPRAARRGTSVRLSLTGNGVGRASSVFFTEPGLKAEIVAPAKPDANRLEVNLSIAGDVSVGLHRFSVVTPLGVTPSQVLGVEAEAESAEIEPNDDPSQVKPVAPRATLVGAIDRPGDVNHFRMQAKRGDQLVFAMNSKSLGSTLQGGLSLLDEAGQTLAESASNGADPLLSTMIERDGLVTLKVWDVDFGGSGGHFYRIAADPLPFASSVFPLGVARGETALLHVEGLNLESGPERTLPVPSETTPGTLLPVPLRTQSGLSSTRRRVVVAEGAQSVEYEPNDEPSKASAIATPGGVSGRIESEGDVDLFRFQARRGERLIVEVFGRRLGTRIDPVLEILDARGQPVPRALLEPIAETEVAFRDHNSTGSGIRLTQWNNLAVNDVVLMGRELTRIFALPRNPDDDCQFLADQGKRVGLLETTPEHHPMGQPIYKVAIHPPGTTLAARGVAPVTLDYRNDDGGATFDKDSRITFDPPADGAYIARIRDVRGLGGRDFGYHLVVRPPRPGFALGVSPENPNIPRGGQALVSLHVTRQDGFEGGVNVTVEGLPPGISATSARIEPGESTALLALLADATAPAFSPPSWRLVARGFDAAGGEVRHEIDPGGRTGGRITVVPAPNLEITSDRTRLTIRPGEQAIMKLNVERSPAFTGRVPIEVRNLPQGVRVLNIGLNGVLVTETEHERTITLFAEPWTEPLERPFYAVGKAESAGTEESSPPILLVIEPPDHATGSASR